LTEEEKTLFRRLSVFSGGFDLVAVEKICSDGLLPLEYILELLGSLVDRSMVNTIRIQTQPKRYYLLETLRQYAAGLLEDKEEKKIRKRHLDYFVSMTENVYENRLISQVRWMQKLQLEHDNIISAINWAERHNHYQFVKLAGSISWFWARSKNYLLGRQILGGIIDSKKARNAAKAKILAGYAWVLVTDYNQLPVAIDNLRQSYTIWKRLNDKKEESIVRADYALMYYATLDDETGLKYAQEAYELARMENDPAVLLHCMVPVSQGFVNLKIFDKAKAMANKILLAAEESDNLFALFIGHHNLGDVALMEGDYHKAEKEYGKGVEITEQFGDMHYLFTDLTGIAMAVAGMGRYAKTLRLIGAVNNAAQKAHLMSLEDYPLNFWQELIKKHIHGTREKLGEELTKEYESEGRAMDLDETITYALDFDKD
jgi:non-specific serine/threonine protein kinase